MSALDPALLPEGPLSMSTLLALEPAALRRLLKGGLRLGLTPEAASSLLLTALKVPLATLTVSVPAGRVA